MKKIPCQTISGQPCKLIFEGESFEDILVQAQKHFQSEAAHKSIYDKINKMSEEERDEWNDYFVRMWEGLPEMPETGEND